MQTFLPFSDYALSAQALDNKRLGKQRVETLQILQVLLGERLITSTKRATATGRVVKDPLPKTLWARTPVTSKGWSHHPAVLMWKGYELELLAYQKACCEEWKARGFKETCLEKSECLLAPHSAELGSSKPAWLGNEKFHRSHRSNLLRKEEDFYSKLWTDVPNDLPYEWPVKAGQE